jgi:hypothetical protein
MLSERFEKEFVGVTPYPLFARLEGTDQRMFRRVVMFRRVLVRRRVAATDVTASQTQAQMHPTASAAQTIFAASRAGRDFLDLIQMCTSVFHSNSSENRPRSSDSSRYYVARFHCFMASFMTM